MVVPRHNTTAIADGRTIINNIISLVSSNKESHLAQVTVMKKYPISWVMALLRGIVDYSLEDERINYYHRSTEYLDAGH